MSHATDWRLMPDVAPAAAACFADLDRVFALDGEVIAQDSMSRTLRVEVGGKSAGDEFGFDRRDVLEDTTLRLVRTTPMTPSLPAGIIRPVSCPSSLSSCRCAMRFSAVS